MKYIIKERHIALWHSLCNDDVHNLEAYRKDFTVQKFESDINILLKDNIVVNGKKYYIISVIKDIDNDTIILRSEACVRSLKYYDYIKKHPENFREGSKYYLKDYDFGIKDIEDDIS